MKVIFKELDKKNWEECVELKVSKEQENYVASNWYSILESKFEEEIYPLCIYNEEELMVGFVMYDLDHNTNRMEMCRLMVDKKFQGNGYGKMAVLKLLDLIRKKYGKIKFYTSIEPENIVAQKLYESLGFEKTGEIMWDEEVMTVQL